MIISYQACAGTSTLADVQQKTITRSTPDAVASQPLMIFLVVCMLNKFD